LDWTFITHLLVSWVVGAALCAWARRRHHEAGLSKTFAVLATLAGIASLLLVAARSVGSDSLRQLARTALQPLPVVSTWIVGWALAFAVAAFVGKSNPRIARVAATGAALFAAASFFGFEIGKLAHDAEMRQFFVASGLPVWSMYVVMAVETIAAVLLLFERARPLAAAVLVTVMLGAIGTHWHNGDPWSDSSDAIRMLLLAVAILLLSAGVHRRRRY
jgi:uncharacterized membrane protein YphA (DoxX/SURF4 family)